MRRVRYHPRHAEVAIEDESGAGYVIRGHRKCACIAIPFTLVAAEAAYGRAADGAEHLRVEVGIVQVAEMAEHVQLAGGVPVDLFVGGDTVEGEIGGRKIVVAGRGGTAAGKKLPRSLLQKAHELLR